MIWQFNQLIIKNMMNIKGSRTSDFREIFARALQSVKGQACIAEYLQQHPVVGDVYLVAIGKAACSMAAGVQLSLGGRIKNGLVITRHGYREPELSGIHVLEAGHPVPDAASIEAGRQLLAFIERVPDNASLLFLISGGASSLVEVLPEGVSIAELQQLNQYLLKSGLSISQMNTIRKQVSCIKGGRLASYLQGREATVLLMSDVQGDDPAVIGSGLLSPSPSPLTDRSVDTELLPENICKLLDASPELPRQDDSCFENIHWRIVANLQRAINAAGNAARELGYITRVHKEYLQGDAIRCGKHIAQIMQAQPNVVHIWGGETTVTLPSNPGTGGRCQSMALSAAIAMGNHDDWCLLTAGTDGSDGTTDAAGVCIDGNSLGKAEQRLAGSAEQYLNGADAGTFFAASDDLLITGPTGANVADIVLGYFSTE